MNIENKEIQEIKENQDEMGKYHEILTFLNQLGSKEVEVREEGYYHSYALYYREIQFQSDGTVKRVHGDRVLLSPGNENPGATLSEAKMRLTECFDILREYLPGDILEAQKSFQGLSDSLDKSREALKKAIRVLN